MKLAEGLLLRADLKKKIEHLVARIRPVLIVSEDQVPQEDPIKLLAQIRKANQDLEAIIVRVNKTNNETFLEDGLSLMEALAKRDSLKLLSERLRNIRQWAQLSGVVGHRQRGMLTASAKATVDIKALQIEIDQTARVFRELDSKIQETNWLTELKE